MKRVLLSALLLFSAGMMSAAAQSDDIILQLTVTEFLEESFRAVADQFEAENPGIQVELVTLPGFGIRFDASADIEDYLDEVQAYFSSADVLLVDTSISTEATRAGFLLDLTPLVSSDPSFNRADWHDVMLRSFEWDGGTWALPVSGSVIVVSYLPTAFDEVGLAYPTTSWTMDDLAFAARTLAKFNANGTIASPGLMVNGSENVNWLFLSLLGQGLIDESTFPNVPAIENPQLESLLTTWTELRAEGVMDFPQGEFNPQNIPLQIGTGFSFISIGSDGTTQTTERTASLLPGGRAGVSVNGYAISSGTQYPDEAYRLIQYLTNNPTVVNSTFGGVPARLEITGSEIEPGQGSGPGGFRLAVGAAPVAPEVAPILDEALANAIPFAETRFAGAITEAISRMESDGKDAGTALEDIQAEYLTRLEAADERGATTQITVNAPQLAPTLAAGEIAIHFGATGFASPFPNEDEWRAAADEFAAMDAEVGYVNLETGFPSSVTELAETYDCFYAPNNFVPDADLSVLRNLDPLLMSDPAYDASDFVSGVLPLVQRENMTWALPITIMPQVMRYNVDWFNQAGVPLPQGTWTVAEFEDALRNLSAVLPEGTVPFQPSGFDSSYLLTLMAAYGGLPLDTRTDPPTVNFTDPSVMAAIQQVLDLYKVGYITYDELVGGAGGAVVRAFGGDSERPLYTETLNTFGVGGGGVFVFRQGPGGGAPELPENTDGLVTFPRGTQYNVVPMDLGTAYISATTLHTEACYRFIQHLSNSPELFDSMPARRSVINSPAMTAAQNAEMIAFYNALADLMQEPNTLILPVNLVQGRGSFGLTYWLFSVFDRYAAGEVTDLEAELRQAQTYTEEFLACSADIPPFQPGMENPQSVFEQIIECATSVDPNAASFFGN